jgi:hypothetical protein
VPEQPQLVPMNSRQKVLAMIARAEELDAGVDPQLQLALTGLAMMRGTLVGLIPEDPAKLDEVLLQGALWALSLRSDDAAPYGVMSLAQAMAAEGGEPA